MIVIPNMEKPKGCRWCPLNHDSICYVIQPYKTDETNGEQCRNDCPLIDIVQCKDCKHYDTESRTFPCCTDIFGAVRYMEADGFCSKGERRADNERL